MPVITVWGGRSSASEISLRPPFGCARRWPTIPALSMLPNALMGSSAACAFAGRATLGMSHSFAAGCRRPAEPYELSPHIPSVCMYPTLMSTTEIARGAAPAARSVSPEVPTDKAYLPGVGCDPSASNPPRGDPRCSALRVTRNRETEPFRFDLFVRKMPRTACPPRVATRTDRGRPVAGRCGS
jgi:hypothetical protein